MIGVSSIQRLRYTESRSATGRAVRTLVSYEVVPASVQPVSGAEAQRLPEGLRTRVRLKAYVAPGTLRCSDDREGHPADVVGYRGEQYEVMQVEEHPDALLAHQKAYLARLESAPIPTPAPPPPPPEDPDPDPAPDPEEP